VLAADRANALVRTCIRVEITALYISTRELTGDNLQEPADSQVLGWTSAIAYSCSLSDDSSTSARRKLPSF
jgi:hypothetical protein